MEPIKAIIFDWGRTLYNRETGEPFPEAYEVLEYCSKNYRLAIVSLGLLGDMEERIEKINKFKFDKYFEFISFTTTNKDTAFRDSTTKFNLEPKEILIVDDRIFRLIWPMANGFKTCWLKQGKFAGELPTLETGNPTFTILNLKELHNII